MYPALCAAIVMVRDRRQLGDITMSTSPQPAWPDPMRPAAHEQAVCPAWCQGGHESDDQGADLAAGTLVRSHQGPSFGRYISTGAEDTLGSLEVPTAIVFELDGVEMSARELRGLADHAAAAADWCEANR